MIFRPRYITNTLQGAVQIKDNLSLEVLEVRDLLCLCGWLLSSVDGDCPFWEVNSNQVVLPLFGGLKLVSTQEVSHHPQMTVTD